MGGGHALATIRAGAGVHGLGCVFTFTSPTCKRQPLESLSLDLSVCSIEQLFRSSKTNYRVAHNRPRCSLDKCPGISNVSTAQNVTSYQHKINHKYMAATLEDMQIQT